MADRRAFNKINILLALVLMSVQAYAQNEIEQYIRQLCTTEELGKAVWGMKAVRIGGGDVAEYNSRTRMIPASNTKLITTGLALLELGPDYRFKTRLAYSGAIKDSTLCGDIYIVGGGDPTIAADDSCSFAVEETFSKWESLLRDAGINRIEGHIIGDGRLTEGEIENYTWEYSDLGTDYGPGGTGLCFFKNVQNFLITPGTKDGDPVHIAVEYPLTPWLSMRSAARTAAAGTGNDLVYVNTDMAPVAEMRGTVEANRKPFQMSGSNKFGAMTCAWYFYKHLENHGIVATEGPADIDNLGFVRGFSEEVSVPAAGNSSLSFIGGSSSPSLLEIAKVTNEISDNFYAETLLRTLALEKTGSAVYDSCTVARQTAMKHLVELSSKGALRQVPADLGEDVNFVDGSGLSRHDYATPSFFVDFLSAMMATEVFNDFLSTIPSPGKGSIDGRLRNAPESVRRRVYMKSGSMSGVRCFSGYITPTSGRAEDTIVFSIMTNNTLVASSRINFIMDKLITLLAKGN